MLCIEAFWLKRATLEREMFRQAESKKRKKWLFMMGADESPFRTSASRFSLFHILSAFFFTSYNIQR